MLYLTFIFYYAIKKNFIKKNSKGCTSIFCRNRYPMYILLSVSNSDKWFQLLDCILSVAVLGTCSERKIDRAVNRDNDVEAKKGIYKVDSIVFNFEFNRGCKGLKTALPSYKRKSGFDRKILTNITIFARVCGWRVKELLLQRCRSHDTMTANHRNV